jgi:hypothetical protein
MYERNKGDIASKYLQLKPKHSLGLSKQKLLDQKTFEAVQNKLRLNPQAKSHKTSPLNNIKLDLNWVQKSPQASKEEAEKSKFFLSRQEKKTRPAHKQIPEHKEESLGKLQMFKKANEERKFKLNRVKELDLNMKGNKEDSGKRNLSKEDKTFNSVNFLSSRIQKEYYMSLEIKRLNKKLKEQKDREQFK